MLISRAAGNNNFLAFQDSRMLRRLTGLLLLTFAATVVPAAGAQQVLGAGDDAWTIPGGTVRLRASGQWDWFNERYDSTGTLHPMRNQFSLDTLGVAQFPVLKSLQGELRSLTGLNALDVSLGKTIVFSSGRAAKTDLGADFGLTHWLQVGVTVPIVKTTANITMITNPAGTEGNVAPNPALSDANSLNQDTDFENQIRQAATSVQTYCATSAGLANRLCSTSGALVTSAQTLSAGLTQVYNTSLFVPTQHSNVQAIINNHIQTVVSQLNTYAAIQGSGVTAITSAGVVAAAAPVVATELQQVLQNPIYGIGMDSLRTAEQVHIGDIELATKILLLDSFHGSEQARTDPHGLNGRFAVGVMYRLPTGEAPPADNLVALPTGSHEGAIGIRGYLDLLFGSHLWTSFVTRYDNERGTDLQMRIPLDAGNPFIPAYATTTVHRKTGNLMELEATPRWVINDFMALTGQYTYAKKSQDQYTGTSFTVGPDSLTGGQTVVIDPTTLSAGTAFTEQTVAAGLSFSNLHAVAQHKSSVPIEVNYLHRQTIKGSGDNIPQTFRDRIEVRLYIPIFGKQ